MLHRAMPSISRCQRWISLSGTDKKILGSLVLNAVDRAPSAWDATKLRGRNLSPCGHPGVVLFAALPSSVFDQQKAFLVKLAADEVATAKIEIAAQRDVQLVQLMNGRSDQQVGQFMKNRLNALAGAESLAESASPDKRIADDRVAIDNDTALVTIATAQLKTDGYTGTLPTCDSPLTGIQHQIHPTHRREIESFRR